MRDTTPLDQAHAAMEAASEDDTARLAFYERLASSELFLLLKADAEDGDDTVTPEVFELEDASYVLAFDTEDRLASFAGQISSYVALSGRVIVQMLVNERIGLGVNLDVAPSAILLQPPAVTWLHETLGNAPDEVEAQISELHPPGGLPDQLLTAIDAKLATAMGLATAAYLVGVSYQNGTRGHLLAFVGAVPAAEGALAQAASEALTFSGIEAGAMDVAFFSGSNPIVEKLDRVGLRFDLPQLQQSAPSERPAPGMDPANPPKLK